MYTLKKCSLIAFVSSLLLLMPHSSHAQTDLPYPIVDTGQNHCFSSGPAIACGSAFVGQDAEYRGLQPAYQVNGDGTVTDLNTGLMWLQDPGSKTTYEQALQTLQSFSFAGYSDWRLPTIKELYSITLFTGLDPSELESSDVEGLVPYIDTNAFNFLYGDKSGGARVIDSQWLTSTINVSTVMGGQSCFFGFNFADGRIKCYPLRPGGNSGYFALFVRGNVNYGVNDFVNNGDGTITDRATGLMWAQGDSGAGLSWNDALSYCQVLDLGGHTDWRLPNVKELQSIVDYTRAPDVTNSPAIDPVFNTSSIVNEGGQPDYPYFWSSTSHLNYVNGGEGADYVSFGRALGYMEQFGGWNDVHGAGAQRSDPKTGDPSAYPTGFGPQGDAIRFLNYVRCVRGGVAEPSSGADPSSFVVPGINNRPSGPPNQGQNGGQQGPGQQGAAQQGPDLAAAAQRLGISQQELMEALGPPPPDFAAAAARLGISQQELMQALGLP